LIFSRNQKLAVTKSKVLFLIFGKKIKILCKNQNFSSPVLRGNKT